METTETTQLLRAWAGGDQGALERLTPRVYEELRRIAGACMQNEQGGRTLQTTALVHETYLRLIGGGPAEWEHRAHFFAVCARIMRHILLDAARGRRAAKRGGSKPKLSLDVAPDVSPLHDRELIALDDALETLAKADPRRAQVVELRFFGGLTAAETAQVLKVSEDTVLRDWRIARAWLLAELNDGEASEPVD